MPTWDEQQKKFLVGNALHGIGWPNMPLQVTELDCFAHTIWKGVWLVENHGPTQMEIITNGEANEEIPSNCLFRPEKKMMDSIFWMHFEPQGLKCNGILKSTTQT